MLGTILSVLVHIWSLGAFVAVGQRVFACVWD